MLKALPSFVRAERDALLEEIEAAFDGVSRQGGVSWSKAAVADAYGDANVAELTRSQEKDARWQDLVPDTPFFPGDGIGYWPFLDPIGFLYYLPAAMVKSVRSGTDATICFPLTVRFGDRNYFEARYTLLNLRQRLCVKRFLEYMDVVEELSYREPTQWGNALASYWGKLPYEKI